MSLSEFLNRNKGEKIKLFFRGHLLSNTTKMNFLF